MGLFSSRKKTLVSSVIYNMAGPIEERPKILPTLVVANVLRNAKISIADSIQQGLMSGTGMRLRSYHRWAQNHYDAVGVPQDTLYSNADFDNSVLEAHISSVAGQTVKLNFVDTGPADVTYWATQWMYENMPTRVLDDWTVDYDPGSFTVIINFDDGVTLPEMFILPYSIYGFGHYIYAGYQEEQPTTTGPVTVGATIDLNTDPFPDTTGWTGAGATTTPYTATLDRVVTVTKSYSDARPNEVTGPTTTTSSEVYDDYVGMFTRTTYIGQDPAVDRIYSIKEYLRLHQTKFISPVTTTVVTTEDAGGGVTRTVTTVTVQDTLVIDRDERIDTQEITHVQFEEPRMFIYKVGSGVTALDEMFPGQVIGDGGYLPMIPVRLDNNFVSETYKPELYAAAKKAYKKATNGKLDELIESLEDNEDLGDIDFAYVTFGVSLNTKENAAGKYLYEFFNRLRLNSITTTVSSYAAWLSEYDAYAESQEDYFDWEVQQVERYSETFGGMVNEDIAGRPAPTIPPRHVAPPRPVTNIRIRTNSSDETNFDMEITWTGITEVTGTGLFTVDAKVGQVTVGSTTTTNTPVIDYGFLEEGLDRIDTVQIWKQVTADSWKRLDIKGLLHTNHVYNGKTVEITGREAMEDEEESGFLIPLHYDTLKEISLVDLTQMSTAATYLTFNCYQIVKKKWYQRGLFKVLLVIIAIVVFVVTGGSGSPLSAAMLNLALAIGTALGFTAIIAIVVGYIVLMIAQIIISQILMWGLTNLFGEDFAAVFMAISAAVTAGINMGSMASSATSMVSALSNPAVWMSITDVLGRELMGNIRKDYEDRTQQVVTDYNKEAKRIRELYAANIGYGTASIDPRILTDSFGSIYESATAFLDRTLMTGSDLADMTNSMIANFSELTLSVDIVQ